jgi:hypothetical protein
VVSSSAMDIYRRAIGGGFLALKVGQSATTKFPPFTRCDHHLGETIRTVEDIRKDKQWILNYLHEGA